MKRHQARTKSEQRIDFVVQINVLELNFSNSRALFYMWRLWVGTWIRNLKTAETPRGVSRSNLDGWADTGGGNRCRRGHIYGNSDQEHFTPKVTNAAISDALFVFKISPSMA